MITVEEDDEDNDCLVIDEERIQLEEFDVAKRRNFNATDDQTNKNIGVHIVPIANNKQTNRNNSETPPCNIVGLMKNFNLENFRINHPNIFNNDAIGKTHKNVDGVAEKKEQIKSNGARVSCKDFARIPFDNGSNLISPEFLENSELYAHLTGRVNTTRSLDDPVHSNAISKSKEGFPGTANYETNNSRHLHVSNRLTQAQSSYAYGSQDPQSGSLNTEVRSSIPPNINVNAVRAENMTTSIPVTQYGSVIVPYPRGTSSTANTAEILLNANRQTLSNNCKRTEMNKHSYGSTAIAPHFNREMYASDENGRQMYAQNLTASLASSPNINACRYPCCWGRRKPMNMGAIIRPALPPFQSPRMPASRFLGPCNVLRPFYPSAHPYVPMQPNFQTTDPQNRYAQAGNGNGAMSRDGLYRVEDPIAFATYEQAYLAALRRKSIATGSSIIKKQNTKTSKAEKTTITKNLDYNAPINVNPSFPTSSASHQETTTNCYDDGNTIPNWEAFGTIETVTNKKRTKTSMKTKYATIAAASNVHCKSAKAPLSMQNHLQPNNANIKSTQAYNNMNNTTNKAGIALNSDAHLQRQTMEMRIPTEHGEITVAYNMTNASLQQTKTNTLNNEAQQNTVAMDTNKRQVPVNPEHSKDLCTINSERTLIPGIMKSYPQQARSNVNTDQSQVNMEMHTIGQIIVDTVDKAMQSNMLQLGTNNGTESVHTSMNTKACIRQTSMKTNGENTVALFDMNNYEASTYSTPMSTSIAQASSKVSELKAADPFTGVEAIRDNIDITDPISNPIIPEVKMQTDVQKDRMSMNMNKDLNTQQARLDTNSENAQIALITDASLQQVEKTMNADKTQISMNMQTSEQRPKMDTSCKRVQILKNTEACVLQDSLNTNIETAPQIFKAVVQANNASKLKIPTSFTAAKSIIRNVENTELESRSDTLNAVTDLSIKAGTQLDKMYLTINKAQAPFSIEKPRMNSNENSNIPLPLNAHLHQAGMGINTYQAINTIDLTVQTNVQQSKMYKDTERIQTSMSTEEACIRPVCMNKNVDSASVLLSTNLKSQIKVLQHFNAVTHVSNTCEIEVSTPSTTTESIVNYTDSIDLEPKSNTLNTEADSGMEVSSQQDRPITNKNNENLPIPLIMEDYPQQDNMRMNVCKKQRNVRIQNRRDKNNTFAESSLALISTNSYRTQTTIIESPKPLFQASSNACKLNVPTSFVTAESIHNFESSEFVLNTRNLNPETALATDAHTSDTTEDITQTQVTVKQQRTKDPVEHISIDFLRSVLRSVKSYSTLSDNRANNKSSHYDNTKKNNINTITDTQLIDKEKEKSQIIKNEKENLKIARQRLALWSKRNENNHDQSNAVDDNTHRTIAPNYDSIISSVLKRANISQILTTPHDVFPVEPKKIEDNNNYITKTELHNVKSNQSNNCSQKQTVVTTYRKRKFQNDRGINETDDSEAIEKSEKHNRNTAKVRDKTHGRGYSPQAPDFNIYTANKDQKTNIATKLCHVSVALSKDKNNEETEKEANKTSDEELSINEFLFFQFQIDFFGRLHGNLENNGLQESADNLSYDIYNLIYISDNEDAKADMEFECPNCHYISIYSPRLFYYKGDDYSLQKSVKIAHCEICIGIRKQYIISLRKYILRNTEMKTMTTSSENNAKEGVRTMHSNNDYRAQSTHSDSSLRKARKDAEPHEKKFKTSLNDNNGNDKNLDKNHNASKKGGKPTNNHENKHDIQNNLDLKISADTLQNTHKSLDSNSINMEIENNRSISIILEKQSMKHHEVESCRTKYKEKENERGGETEDSNNNSSENINDTDNNSNKVGDGINKSNDDCDPLEEQLNLITNGVTMNSEKTMGDKQNKHSEKTLPVKLPWNKLNLSTVQSLIKNRNIKCHETKFTLNTASINIDENDQMLKRNPNIQKMLSAITATNNSPQPLDRNISTATDKMDHTNKNNQNYGGANNKCSSDTVTNENTVPNNRNIIIATINNDSNNKNNKKGLKVRKLIGVEKPTKINAELSDRHGNTKTNNNGDSSNSNKINHITNTTINKNHNNGHNYKVRSSTHTETVPSNSENQSNGNITTMTDVGVSVNKNYEVYKINGTESAATRIAESGNNGIYTATSVNDDNNKNEKHCKGRKSGSEAATNTNTEPHKKNTTINTNNDYNKHNKNNRKGINTGIAATKNGDPRNRFVNTPTNDNSDINKSIERNRIHGEGAESAISINSDSCKENISVSNDNGDTATTSPNVEQEPKNNKANNDNIEKNHDVRKSISAETLLNTRQPSVSYSVNMAKENNTSTSIKLRKVSVGHNEVKARGTNAKEKENDEQGGETEDDNKDDSENNDNNSSDKDDNESDGNSSSDEDDNESSDEANQTARKAIDDAFKTLKEKCNPNENTKLPQVHIPGKSESKKSSEPTDEALKRKRKLCYSYECHKCTVPFKHLRKYYNHMRNHGIYNEMVPEDCVLKKCKFCDLDIRKTKYKSHIQYRHGKQFTKKY